MYTESPGKKVVQTKPLKSIYIYFSHIFFSFFYISFNLPPWKCVISIQIGIEQGLFCVKNNPFLKSCTLVVIKQILGDFCCKLDRGTKNEMKDSAKCIATGYHHALLHRLPGCTVCIRVLCVLHQVSNSCTLGRKTAYVVRVAHVSMVQPMIIMLAFNSASF